MTETAGPGTDRCGTCGGAKEPTRRGSVNCRACDKALSKRSQRRYRLTLSVPEAVWDALMADAVKAGVSPYVMANRVLAAWGGASEPVSDSSDTAETREAERKARAVTRQSLTDEQLARARKWIDDTERTLPSGITTRTALREWLATEGFVL